MSLVQIKISIRLNNFHSVYEVFVKDDISGQDEQGNNIKPEVSVISAMPTGSLQGNQQIQVIIKFINLFLCLLFTAAL